MSKLIYITVGGVQHGLTLDEAKELSYDLDREIQGYSPDEDEERDESEDGEE